MNHKILIIDDDAELCQLLRKCVSMENIDAAICHSGKEGLDTLIYDKFQLIVLDVMMTGMDGFDALKRIREISNIPVLMLTSKSESSDKVHGLKLGADDYLTKPFDIEEFTARVLSLIRRYTTLNSDINKTETCFSFKGMTLEYETRLVTVQGQPVELVGKEFDILYYCAKNQGKILTKQQIYENVWKETYAYDDSNIMAVISRLRKKIEPDIGKPMYIQTVKGVGYRFNREV